MVTEREEIEREEQEREFSISEKYKREDQYIKQCQIWERQEREKLIEEMEQDIERIENLSEEQEEN